MLAVVGLMLAGQIAFGQIDPEKRQLIQLGFNQPLEGRGPIAGYAFYYLNEPGFLQTNITLRLAVAPVYLDSELGFRNALGEHTDLGIGVAGGGYANSYYEMRSGKYFREESFTGHGGEVSTSVYHLFNPSQRVPLNGVFRVSPHYTVFERDDETKPNFVLPDDHASLNVRTGLRLGGSEPVIRPDIALELSVWYEGQFRDSSGTYGFNGDRNLEPASHLFWSRALFIYTFDNKQSFGVSLTGGTSLNVDRFSAYRLGGDLPLSSEFPLILPGYYYQEISARNFVCFTADYSVPLDPDKHWSLTGIGSVAEVDYAPGLSQPGHFNSGVGLGLRYRSPSGWWNVMAGYGYGFEAIRDGNRGAQSIGILAQIDLEAHHRSGPLVDETGTAKSRGLFRFFDWF